MQPTSSEIRKALKISVIDIGSNTLKLVNYDVKKDLSFTAFQQESTKVRLGESLDRTHNLSDQSIERAIDTLLLYRDIIKMESVKRCLCIGTSAVREAQNSAHFLDQVYKKTGFKIRILSGKEEAYYSYLGASMFTYLPNALLFDLGGGSLELAYTEEFTIKKVDSLPLGALRLTQIYGKKDSSFSRKDCDDMVQKIHDSLPTRKSYGIGIDTVLTGVGGTLRTLTKYDQGNNEYPIEKIHNYRLKLSAIESICKELGSMNDKEISCLRAMDATRAETIVAGSYVIQTLMKKLEFEEVIVSTYGLREGVIAAFLRNPDFFNYYKSEDLEKQIPKIVSNNYKPNIQNIELDNILRHMIYHGLLKEREVEILLFAINTLTKLYSTNKLLELFYIILDEDFPYLTHREQLVLALSIIQSKKAKTSDWLYSKYRSILKPQNQKSIQKIGILLKLNDLIVKSRSRIKLRETKNNGIIIDVSSSIRSYPVILFQNIIQRVSEVFGIAIECYLPSNLDSPIHAENGMITVRSK
jgi:exopolyphosphatase / guanosine-5'-triphosphate,3'-diphosphate pyrophosphatase